MTPRNGVGLFTLPRSFIPPWDQIQHNAINSWKAASNNLSITLFGNDPGVAEAAAFHRVGHVAEISRNSHGTPLVNGMFKTMAAQGGGEALCYINADIIVLRDFFKAVERAMDSCWPSLLIGRRWDIPAEGVIDFAAPNTGDWLKQKARESGRLHNLHAMDFFVFPRLFWSEVPAFAIGRTYWDNWFVYDARRRGLPVIDLSSESTVIHQNHAYNHVKGGARAVWFGSEAEANFKLLGGFDNIYDLRDADWVLASGGLKPAAGAMHKLYRVRHLPLARPFFRPLQKAKRRLLKSRTS